MRNGRKGEYPDLPFCVVVWLPSYMTEPFRKSGLRFRILPQSIERVESWKPCHISILGSVYNSEADTTFERTGADTLRFPDI